MLTAILVLALSAVSSGKPACAVDTEAMLALDVRAFDQDVDGGWTALSFKPGCEEAAADLIAHYRQRHPDVRYMPYLLPFHEGQIRLGLGQTNRAIALFEAARQPKAPIGFDTGWNFYIDASIAFARGDLKDLRAARAQLAVLPLPPEFPTSIKWPMNLMPSML